MKYTVQTSLRDDVLEVRLAGERSPFEIEIAEDAIDTWEHILELCRVHRVDSVLASFALTGPTTALVSVAVARRLATIGFDRTLRVALLDHNGQSRPFNDFGCRVAAGHGWQFRSFADAGSAMRWLKESAGGEPAVAREA